MPKLWRHLLTVKCKDSRTLSHFYLLKEVCSIYTTDNIYNFLQMDFTSLIPGYTSRDAWFVDRLELRVFHIIMLSKAARFENASFTLV